MKKIVIIVLCLFLITGCSIKKVKELTDSEKFATEYNIDEENPFIYATYEDIDNIFKTNGIIFLATPDATGSQKATKVLLEVAKKNNIKKIYYYNPKKIKGKNPKKYKKLVKRVEEYLEKEDKEENYKSVLPILISVKNGNIVGFNNYFSKESELSEEKLTKKKLNEIKKEYEDILKYRKCTNYD